MKKKLTALFLAAIMCMSLHIGVGAINIQEEQVLLDEPHVYTVLPGSIEWKEMTPEERRASCYVSEDEASSMTTSALVEPVLNYPYFINVYCFDSFDRGIEMLAQSFPPLAELLTRVDAYETLQDYNEEKTVFLTDDAVDLNAYGAETLQIYLGKNSNIEKADLLLELETYAAPETNEIRTPNDSPIEVYVDMTWDELSALRGQRLTETIAKSHHQDAIDAFPDAEEIRGVSCKYNCHSYAWYSTSSSNKLWMNNPGDYINDGSYVSSGSVKGNRVTYTTTANDEIIHSGIVTDVSSGPITITSKWGYMGLFSHPVNDCPYVPSRVPQLGNVSIGLWARA